MEHFPSNAFDKVERIMMVALYYLCGLYIALPNFIGYTVSFLVLVLIMWAIEKWFDKRRLEKELLLQASCVHLTTSDWMVESTGSTMNRDYDVVVTLRFARRCDTCGHIQRQTKYSFYNLNDTSYGPNPRGYAGSAEVAPR